MEEVRAALEAEPWAVELLFAPATGRWHRFAAVDLAPVAGAVDGPEPRFDPVSGFSRLPMTVSMRVVTVWPSFRRMVRTHFSGGIAASVTSLTFERRARIAGSATARSEN